MPRSEGISLNNADIASSPPVEEPMATIGKDLFFFLAVTEDLFFAPGEDFFLVVTLVVFFRVFFFSASLFLATIMIF